MKKIISVLIVSLLLTALTLPAQAADTPTFSIHSVTGRSGDVVEVAVNISNNPGITSLQLMTGYSSSDLELLSVNDCNLFSDSATYSPLSKNPMYISWFASNSGNSKGNGDFVKLRFKIKNGASNSHLTLSYDSENVFNSEFNNIKFTAVNGSVDVTDKQLLLGDANLDDAVTIVDATFIQRYIANIPTPSGMNVTVSDTDGDNIITIMDSTAIQSWLAQMDTNNDIGLSV